VATYAEAVSRKDRFGHAAFYFLVASAAAAVAFIALLIVAVFEHERAFERCRLDPPGWERPATGYPR
jgi:hypothetical protein